MCVCGGGDVLKSKMANKNSRFFFSFVTFFELQAGRRIFAELKKKKKKIKNKMS